MSFHSDMDDTQLYLSYQISALNIFSQLNININIKTRVIILCPDTVNAEHLDSLSHNIAQKCFWQSLQFEQAC